MTSLITFDVAYVIETLGAQEGFNVVTHHINDVCYGVIIGGDQTLTQFLQKHKNVYNYQIVDGDPIRVVRRQVDLDLSIDLTVEEADCIVRSAGQPAIKLIRADPLSLPREIELQYIDIDAHFAMNTQVARHPNAQFHQGRQSVQTDFILSAGIARSLAYSILYRRWMRQLTLAFEHPDPRIEPSDVLQINSVRGVYVILVDDTILTKDRTSQVKGSVLLTSQGITVAAGQRDPIDTAGAHHVHLS